MKIRASNSEKSFTLLETIIALGLMVTMVLEISSVQGSAMNFSEYERKVTQATWLAKAVMSKIEYQWKFLDLKEFKIDKKEQTFDEFLCDKDPKYDCNFKYNVSIKDWKLPLVEIILGKKGRSSEGDEEDPMSEMIKEQLKETLGEELLRVAYVEVMWPEGSKQNSVELAYLLTNQQVLDSQIEQLKPVDSEGSSSSNSNINDTLKCKENETLESGKCVPKK